MPPKTKLVSRKAVARKTTAHKVAKPERVAELRVERMTLTNLKPHPRNHAIRMHPDEGSPKWNTLQKSLEHDYFDPIVHNERNGFLVSGHLRLKVMLASGFTKADVVVVDYDEHTHIARMLAANKGVGDNDLEGMAEMFRELRLSEVSLDLTGFSTPDLREFAVTGLFDPKEFIDEEDEYELDGDGELQANDIDDDAVAMYSKVIQAPTYEITGDKPDVDTLADSAKTDKLIARISKAKIPEDVREFLIAAAGRHTVFHFSRIAEFYAHAPSNIQDLMEESALVIIDFKRALADGYIQLGSKLEGYSVEDAENAAESGDVDDSDEFL